MGLLVAKYHSILNAIIVAILTFIFVPQPYKIAHLPDPVQPVVDGFDTPASVSIHKETGVSLELVSF